MCCRKSQSSLEFLVTYGWAILGVMIVVSALIYFGIFNTSRYVNDFCNFGEQLKCEDYILNSTGGLGLKLRNNFGVSIDITEFVVRSSAGAYNCDVSTTITPSPNSITQGSVIDLICQIATINDLSINDKHKSRATVSFRKSGASNPLHNQTGEMIITVQ